MQPRNREIYRFSAENRAFELIITRTLQGDTTYQLRRNERPINRWSGKPWQLLLLLLTNGGAPVNIREVHNELWGNQEETDKKIVSDVDGACTRLNSFLGYEAPGKGKPHFVRRQGQELRVEVSVSLESELHAIELIDDFDNALSALRNLIHSAQKTEDPLFDIRLMTVAFPKAGLPHLDGALARGLRIGLIMLNPSNHGLILSHFGKRKIFEKIDPELVIASAAARIRDQLSDFSIPSLEQPDGISDSPGSIVVRTIDRIPSGFVAHASNLVLFTPLLSHTDYKVSGMFSIPAKSPLWSRLKQDWNREYEISNEYTL